jgi:adenine-specific DNA-methyltransferase
MQNLQNELISLLEGNSQFLIDGELNKNKLVEASLKVDKNLIKILASSSALKNHFFQDLDGILVFDKVAFQRFVTNKSLLPDSYTAFKNKIGLVSNDANQNTFISSKDEIVLTWAYKDCILEGGQSRENQKRNEVFWNETLAPESVDRLLSPKVFTNFKKFDNTGEQELNEIKGDENLILKGNNLLCLASLLPKFRGKIKFIYIDPPYNTGNDAFNYNDSFKHSTWLTFMKNRLVMARELLTDDGVIFISCDDNEVAYLKVLMDELFQKDNFVDIFSWKKTDTPSNLAKKSKKVLEYILCYEKNKDKVKYKGIEKTSKSSNGLMNKTNAVGVLDFPKNAVNTALGNGIYPRGTYGTESYKIVLLEDTEVKNGFFVKNVKLQGKFKWGQKKLENELKKGTSIAIRTKTFSPSYEKLSYEIEAPSNLIDSSLGVQTTENAGRELTKLFGKEVFSYPKSESLIHYLINMVSNKLQPNDYILDYHLGSGTTCAVAHKLGYRYIGIEQMDYIKTLSVERLKKVIAGEQTGVSQQVNWQGGGSFVYAELMQYNQFYIDKIQNITQKEELILLWKEMKDVAFLSYLFDNEVFTSNFENFVSAPIQDMKRFLIELLDKNQLYVNYSEIDDENFKISKLDKKLTKEFYFGE